MKTITLAAFAASTALAFAAPAQAGTLIDAYSIFSAQGASPGVGLLAGDTLSPNSSFGTPFMAHGLAYQAGSIFLSGHESSGLLTGGYLKSYNLTGTETASLYGASFVEWGPVAAGNGSVFAGATSFALSGSEYSVNFYNSDLSSQGVSISLSEAATGLAFTGGGLFVAYGSTLARYDLSGSLLGSHDFGSVDIGALAYGNGTLFASYATGSQFGWAAVDPLTFLSAGANVVTDAEVRGLAFGDGGLFVSTEFSLAKYDLAGNQTNLMDTGPVVSNGPLAFIPGGTRPRDPRDPDGGVPEPGTWALMLLGFAGAGAALRSRRRQIAA